MKRRRESGGDDDQNRWVVSYADLVTLLFAFFVVMYAISSLDVRKWDRISIGMKSAFVNPLAGTDPVLSEILQTGGARGYRIGANQGDHEGTGTAAWELVLLRDHLKSIAEQARALGDEKSDPVRLRLSERGLVISLAASPFFEQGSSRLQPRIRPILDGIAKVLSTSGASLRVEGHTDDRPTSSRGYPSNWELSAARAGAVARYLIEKHRIGSSRIAIAGFAGNRPVASNDTPQGRARNRRVDVVVLRSPETPGADASVSEGNALKRLLNQLEPLAAQKTP